MPLTMLDAVAALLVIDLQQGLRDVRTAHPLDEVIDRSAQLARAFRERGLPVVLVNVAGGAPGRTDIVRSRTTLPPDFADLVPELDPQPGDVRITKHRVGAFLGTSLDEQLRQRGVTQVFLAGIATSNGVEATARGAYDLGYNVVLVTDAITDRDDQAHRHSMDKIFPKIGETETTGNILKMFGKY